MNLEEELEKVTELSKHSKSEEALALCEQLLSEIDSAPQLSDKDKEGARSYLKLRKAGLLKDMGQPEEALRLMTEALADAERSRNTVQIGRCKMGLGVMYASLGDLGEGRHRLEEAAAYLRDLHEEGSEQGRSRYRI